MLNLFNENALNIEGHSVKILDKTETREEIRDRRMVIGGIALLAISMVILGGIALHPNIAHSTVVGISFLVSGGLILSIDIAIATILSQKVKRNIDGLDYKIKAQLGRLMRGMRDDITNEITSITKEINGTTYYLTLELPENSTSFEMHCLKDRDRRDQLCRQLEGALPFQRQDVVDS